MNDTPLANADSVPVNASAQNFSLEENEIRKEVQQNLFGEEVLPETLKQIPHRTSNVRREKFVREYVLCGRNATEAAYRAGYGGGDRNKCRYYGSELLSFPDIRALIARFEGELRGKTTQTLKKKMRAGGVACLSSWGSLAGICPKRLRLAAALVRLPNSKLL